ncbi:MAG: GTPase Era [Bacteroidales bacterium]|jgi:GTP-binding protein Era|nr:GTPase Era [Bacteroidales bacterium]
MHKAGFVNIIGNPNVGKSTLMNALVGEKLSIITHKAQTTRHRIMGIASGEDYQIVYSDTPGIVHPHYKLHESMMKFVSEALKDADIFLLITEIGEMIKTNEILEYILKSNIPTIVIINKIDISTQETVQTKINEWGTILPKAKIIPCSALTGFNIDTIFNLILDMLPASLPFFDKEQITDKPLRFFASEIIREKILTTYNKEIPYCVEVSIDEFQELPNLNKISATLFVERESQKAIVIGHNGSMLKRVGILARTDIEHFTGKKCFLSLFVKVSDSWRNNDKVLRKFGYSN